jgi:hypothetical protein
MATTDILEWTRSREEVSSFRPGSVRGLSSVRAETWLPVSRHLLPGALFLLLALHTLTAQPYRDPEESKFTLKNLESVNSSSDDYAPFVTPDGRWFYLTSSRAGSADLYRSRAKGDGWETPEYVNDPDINSKKDEGVLNLAAPPYTQLMQLDAGPRDRTAASNAAVMTASKRPGGAGDADIYLVEISSDGATFAGLKQVPELNSQEWDSQPTVSPDGSFIIFSSTRDGGLGRKDLYIATRDSSGHYGRPVDMGSAINSGGNEVSPYISPDGRTLFFSSDGRGGFGGADIFMSQRDMFGGWSEAKNLGEKINTDNNELFFFGANRSHCYVASDRSGGRGGFDIYEGTPNIFAPGYSTLSLSIRDTVTGRGIGGHVTITERTTGRVIREGEIDSTTGAELPILSGFGYNVTVKPRGFADMTFSLADFPEGKIISPSLNVGSIPPPQPLPEPEPPAITCTFDDVTVPMFVSGYYRLNTSPSLEDLRRRQLKGNLKGQTYITDIAHDQTMYAQYKRFATQVEKIVDNCYMQSIRLYFPQYDAFLKAKNPNEYLEITVRGFADPRPIIGRYVESPVTFLDSNGHEATVRPGDSLDNFRLAGLRAYYAMEYFDNLFRKAAEKGDREYLTLLNKGIIRWRAVSGNVDDIPGLENLEVQRRVRVEFRRVPLGESP